MTLPLAGTRILLTNDDGIQARGIQVLEEIARQLSDDVWIVAPEGQQSAKSHSLTVHHPLRPRQVGPQKWAVDGTPTDCVQLAMRALLPLRKAQPRCDLVLSGVNNGSNLAQDVLYSGTVAGATEGALFGVRAIALSLMPLGEVDNERTMPWETAQAHGAKAVEALVRLPHRQPIVYNVNFPNCAPQEVKGLAAAPQGVRPVGAALEARKAPRGSVYYWFHDLWEDVPQDETSDLALAAKGFITVTPISPDRTHYATLEALGKGLDAA